MKNVLLILFFLFSFYCSAQNIITGKIQDANNTPILLANVLIKQGDETVEFVMARQGKYSITLEKEYTKIIVEITANGYISQTQTLDSVQKNKTYTLNFILPIDDIKKLDEVVISAPKQPIQIKGDTTKFNVSSFSNGSERKIIDIIKKLPGVDVDDKSGEIRFKGKPIETVTLGGDDLFGYNYSLGTKNINVDMVEQVQAIENYSKNPLLKGIESDDKVILNLELKKGKIDLSGEINGGLGINANEKLVGNSNNNFITVAKNYKSFGILSYNNIGVNNSPLDYVGGGIGVEKLKEKDYFANKTIPETILGVNLDNNRSNINNSFFGNYDAIFKIKKRLSIKFNLYYLKDNIFSNQLSQSQNTINNQTFVTSDNRTIYKKPSYYRGDIEMKYNTSKTSLLEYNFRIQQEQINTQSNVLQNNEKNFDNTLLSNDFYLKQNLLFTKKLSTKTALQVLLFHSTNQIPQEFSITPSVFNPNNFEKDVQKINNRKDYTELNATLLGSHKGSKYIFSAKINIENSPLSSNLSSRNDNLNSQIIISINDLNYTKKTFSTTGSYGFERRKWRISPAYSISILDQKIENKIQANVQNSQNFIFEPSLTIRYKLNDVSSIVATSNYKQKPNTETYLFTNPILTSNRSIMSNQPNLSLQNTLSSSLFYRKNDLFNQFRLSFGATYQENNGNFFSNLDIEPNVMRSNYFYLPQNTNSLNFSFSTEKYLDMIESTVKFTSNYSISQYKNIVNNSNLRDNQNNTFNNELTVRTAFEGDFNFENATIFIQNNSKNNQGGRFSNQFLSNISKLVYFPNKKWFFSLSSDYYLPNVNKKTENYLFLDFLARFRPKSKKYEFNFVFNNLLNNDNFTQIETTDYSVNIFQSRLLSRYFLMNVSFNF